MRRSFITAGIIAAAIVSTQPSFAGSSVTSVSTSGFDLSTARGVDAVHREIITAAAEVCEHELRFFDYPGYKDNALKRCIRGTTNDAVADSGHSALVAFHDSLERTVRYDVARAPVAGQQDDMVMAKAGR